MVLTGLVTRMAASLTAAARRLLANYRSLDAQIWQIARTDSPDAPKPRNQPPRMRCC